MKPIEFTLLIAVLLAGPCLFAQSSLDSLLVRVEERNPTLIAAQSLLESRKLDARTGLTPPNPEVEFGYMWGDPTELGNRTDFQITQSFDFPTAYSSRSKLSKINLQQAELEYNATRQEILLAAHQAWVDRVYLNNLKFLLNDRLTYAEKVFEGFERRLETGEANQLQVNQARMKVMALENEINTLQREYSENTAELLNLTAEGKINITDLDFLISVPIIFDSLLFHYNVGYLNQMYETEVEKKSKEIDVVFNQKLPKLMAGYYSENVLDTKLRGIKAGITIPLWGNARAVNTAKANLVFAESDADRYWQLKQNELLQKYEQWIYLKERVTEMEELLAVSNNEILLRQAMEAGEISLTQYFYESDFYFQNILNLFEFKKEMLMLEADLRKVYY